MMSGPFAYSQSSGATTKNTEGNENFNADMPTKTDMAMTSSSRTGGVETRDGLAQKNAGFNPAGTQGVS